MPSVRPPKRVHRSVAHVRSSKQESEVASRYGGRTVRGSGSGSEKGDARLDGVARIECKTTQSKSFSVTREMVDKIATAAAGAGEVPVIEVEFLDARGCPESSIIIMPTWALQTLLSRCSAEPKSPKP